MAYRTIKHEELRSAEGAYMAKIQRDSDTKEYRVRFYDMDANELIPDADYFTTEFDDALNTAKVELARCSLHKAWEVS